MRTPHDRYQYRCITGAQLEAWEGYWITSERFVSETYRPLYAFGRDLENASEEKNIHTLFRKDFVLEGMVQ